MISSLMLLCLVSDFQWVTSTPEPYVGLHPAVFKSRRRFSNNETFKSREWLVKIGTPVSIGYWSTDYFGRVDLIALPELALSDRIIGAFAGIGPEQEIYIGPRRAPMWILLGGQVGPFLAGTYNLNGFRKLVDDGNGRNRAVNQDKSDRVTAALALNAYTGAKFKLTQQTAFRFQVGTKIMYGKVAPMTIRHNTASRVGWTMGANFQLQIAPRKQ